MDDSTNEIVGDGYEGLFTGENRCLIPLSRLSKFLERMKRLTQRLRRPRCRSQLWTTKDGVRACLEGGKKKLRIVRETEYFDESYMKKQSISFHVCGLLLDRGNRQDRTKTEKKADFGPWSKLLRQVVTEAFSLGKGNHRFGDIDRDAMPHRHVVA